MEKILEKRYLFLKKKLVEIDKDLFKDYQEMSYEDLASAKKEESNRWKITKLYQSLFLMCNSLLVKKKGFYSKDHDCLLITLLYYQILPEDILERIKKVFEEREAIFKEFNSEKAFFKGISDIRVSRNNYLYLPKMLRKAKLSVEEISKEVSELIKIIGTIE